jgi:hypothetical protein
LKRGLRGSENLVDKLLERTRARILRQVGLQFSKLGLGACVTLLDAADE